MNNPYKVLGVNEGASQEEIRSAYLKLVKKYHPDKYTDSDLKELANEKLVEVNEAYEMLTKKTSQSSSYASRSGNGTYDSYSGGYTGSGSSYSGPNAQEFNRARAFISPTQPCWYSSSRSRACQGKRRTMAATSGR